jgi:hypothetical protein
MPSITLAPRGKGAGLDGTRVPEYVVRQLAVAALVHPGTVRRFLEGRPTRPMGAARVADAVRRWNAQPKANR